MNPAERRWRRIGRRMRRTNRMSRARGFLRRLLGGLRRPLPIQWETETFGGRYPACPRCHEPAYNWGRCVFCGQRFRQGFRTEK